MWPLVSAVAHKHSEVAPTLHPSLLHTDTHTTATPHPPMHPRTHPPTDPLIAPHRTLAASLYVFLCCHSQTEVVMSLRCLSTAALPKTGQLHNYPCISPPPPAHTLSPPPTLPHPRQNPGDVSCVRVSFSNRCGIKKNWYTTVCHTAIVSGD